MALNGPLLLAVGAALIIAAVVAWRTELRGRVRLAVTLAVAGGLGLLLATADDAGFGRHVILVVDKSEVPRLADSGLLRESLAGVNRIEIVAISPTGRAQTARRCLRRITDPPGVLGAERSVDEALLKPQCDRPWYQTVIAVVPSSRMGNAIAQSAGAGALEVTLKGQLIEDGVPLTLLHDEGRRHDVRWLVTRPYSPATPGSGTVAGSSKNYRVAAYAYALEARRNRATGGTAVKAMEDSTGRKFDRTNVPVMAWDAETDVIGPVPLVDEANWDERLADGVTWFKETRSDDSSWFAVTADTLRVGLAPGDAAWNDQLRSMWAPFVDGSPVTSQELVERAATTFEAARRAQNRFAPFEVVPQASPADAVLVLPDALSPPMDPAHLGFDEGGRALTISRSCGPRERHGAVYLSFDHSRLSQQKAGDATTAGQRQMWVYEALIRHLQAESDRPFVLQATRDGDEKATRGEWESADCSNRGRMSRPMLGRSGNEWMYQLSVASPFFISTCPSAAGITATSPTPNLTVDHQVRLEYVSSHLGLRARLLSQQEPDLSGNTSLVGITIVFLVLDVGQLKSSEIAKFKEFAIHGWESSAALPVPPAAELDLVTALKRYTARDAAVYVVPVAVPPELEKAWSKERILREYLERERPSDRSTLLEGMGVKDVTALVKEQADAESAAKTIAAHVAQVHAPRDVGGAIVRDPRYQAQVRLYDDVCSTGPLLEASPAGRRGVASEARFNLFAPINWLYDESGRSGRKAEAGGAFSTQRGVVGLGAQVIADTLIETARPYGNRRALGARSVQIDESGELVVVAPSHLTLVTVDGVGGTPKEAGYSVIANAGLKRYLIDADEWTSASHLIVADLDGTKRSIALRKPASLSTRIRPFRWLPTSMASGGFVMSGGVLSDYHRSDLWANVVLAIMGILTAVAFSPWVTPWALLSWFGSWRRQSRGDAPASQLSMAEVALVEEAGQAAGRVIARRIAGEPEGVRGFAAGDSPNAILPLDLYSYTPAARKNSVPQLRARVRTRRAQQVPGVAVLLDTRSMAPGQEGRRLREAYTSICAVVTAIALRSGAGVTLMALEGGDELENFRGVLDECALVAAIAAAAPIEHGRGLRPVDDLYGSALCIIVSPVSAENADQVLSYCVDLRSQGTRCLLIQPSLRGEDVPGAYWTGTTRGRGVVQRQRSGSRGHAADHDTHITRLADGMDVDQVLFVDRRGAFPLIADAMIEALRGPV